MSLNSSVDIPGQTEIALPLDDLPGNHQVPITCKNLEPEVGISGTPVIDVSVTPPVIYLVTTHKDVPSGGGQPTYRQKLHGLYADTLQEIPTSPVSLAYQWNSTYFDPLTNLQRPGLALITIHGQPVGNTANIWVAWSSQCDMGKYDGYVIALEYTYPQSITTPGFTNVYEVLNDEAGCPPAEQTLHGCMSGIWMGGAAPAVDESGNVYLTTGNGYDTEESQGDGGEYSNSVLRLTEAGGLDFYTPPDYHALNVGSANSTLVACANPGDTCPVGINGCIQNTYCQRSINGDADLGAGGITLLQPTFGLNNPELVTGGKQGMLYVLFSLNLGHLDPGFSHPDQIACTSGSDPSSGALRQCFASIKNGLRGVPAFLAGSAGTNALNEMYIASVNDSLRAFQLTSTGTFNTTAAVATDNHLFAGRGAVPSVTWNSAGSIADAIVWVLDTSVWGRDVQESDGGQHSEPAVLYAYKAVPNGLGLTPLWNSSAWNATNPGNPGAVKSVVPTVVDGMVFLAGGAQSYWPDKSGAPDGNCLAPDVVNNQYNGNPTGCGAITMFSPPQSP